MDLAKKLLALAFYLAMALIYLLPLPAHWRTHIPGDNGDSVTNLWPFWYYAWALGPGQVTQLFHTPLQFAPGGVDMIYTSGSLIGAVALAPLTLATSAVIALNTWLVLHLWLGGWFFYRFVRGLPVGEAAALLAGAAYAWSPFVAVHLPGHYNLVQIAFPAAALWALRSLAWRAADRQSPRRLAIPALALAAAVAMLAMSDFYLSVMTLLLLILLMGHILLNRPEALRSTRFWQMLGAAIALTAIAITPYILLMLRARESGDYSALSPGFGSKNVATWSRLVNLPAWHSVWGPRIYPEFKERLSSFNEYTYIGITALAVAFIGMLYGKSWRRPLAWIAGFVLVLGLGGANHFSAEPAFPTGPLSFGKWWPQGFPFSEFRVPGRWQFALCSIVAVALALGSDALLGRVRRQGLRGVLAAIFLGVMMFDLMRWPLPIFDTRLPASGIPITQRDKAPAMLDVPFGIISGQGHGLGDYHRDTLLRQMEHHHPLLSANVSRLPNDAVQARKADAEFMALLGVQAGDAGSTAPEDLERLAALDWPGFAQRYNIGIARIPLDYPTSAALHRMTEAMGQWQWTEHNGAMIGVLEKD